ncbi:MAG: DUF5723 family protein [Bacteroidales bacterium]
MTYILRLRFYIFLIIMFIVWLCPVKAQFPVNLHFLKSVPQSAQINPANEPPYTFWIGVPALSSIYLGFENSGFRYKDVVYRTADDSLHLDIDGFLSSLDKNNTFSLEMQTELFAMGFHIKKYCFDLRLSSRSSNYLNYSRDLMNFLVKLNGEYINEEASFSGTGLNASLFNEVSLGISRPVTDKLYAGIRLKYISGVFNIYSRKTNMSLFTDESQAYALTLKSDIEVNTSIPEMVDDPDDFVNFSLDEESLLNDLTTVKNPGYGLDLGVQYTFNPTFNLAVSLTDLGFINWTNNTKNYISSKEQTSFSFEGIDLYEFFENDTLSLSTQLEKVLDSLEDNLGIETQYKNYTSPLLTRMYVAGEFNLSKRSHLGALLRFDMLNKTPRPLICLNYRQDLGRWLQLMLGYSASEGNYMNLGAGFSLKLGFAQVYVITDNAWAVIDPTNFKSCNVQFGMNFCFRDRRL